MQPLRDLEARLPVPFPSQSQDYNRKYATENFETRNLAKKRGNKKVVVTEEALDDWHAQCLNIPYDRLIRHKKMLHNVTH